MNSNHRIIQWNCRGLRSNYNAILLLLSLLSPSVFLQETLSKLMINQISKISIHKTIYIQRPEVVWWKLNLSSLFSCPQREIKFVTNL